MSEDTTKKNKREEKDTKRLVLPRYLRLAKGGMWKDTDGPYASNITIYAFNKVMVGKDPKNDSEPLKDKYNNEKLTDYGYVERPLAWYADLTDIPKENLGRVIIAYNAGILVKADPSKPPVEKKLEIENDYKIRQDGAVVFDGKNKEMYKKLQNLNFNQIKQFIQECPSTAIGHDNLTDLFDYEKRGFNALLRPRFEVLELLKTRLREFGNGITAIRRNEDE